MAQRKVKKQYNTRLNGKYTFSANDIKQMRLYLSTRSGDGTGGQYPLHIQSREDKAKFRKFIKVNGFALKGNDLLKRTTVYLDKEGKIINATKAKKALKESNSNNRLPIATKSIEQIVVADEDLDDVFNKYHVNNGHYGITATRDLISKDYYIKKCTEFVRDEVTNCLKCIQMNKKPQKKYVSPLILKPTPREPMNNFQADLCGPFTESYADILLILNSLK